MNSASESSQADILALSQALEEAQKIWDQQNTEHEAQIAGLQSTLANAEEAILSTNSSLEEAQVDFHTHIHRAWSWYN